MSTKDKIKQRSEMKSMHEFKICVAGASFVGKTQIINRIINNAFY